MAKSLDVLFVAPGDHKKIFQELGNEFSAIEPPALAGLFANYLRNKDCSVGIMDMPAEGLSAEEGAEKIVSYDPAPCLVVMAVYGQQPSASTQNMPVSGKVCRAIKERCPDMKIMMVGTHPSSLPERTLKEEAVNFVAQGEGPVTIYQTVLALKNNGGFEKIPGLWYRENGQIKGNLPPAVIQNIDAEFPGIAWDLLPMEKYRAHNWHCFDDIERRSPYASLHTSFGCPFNCAFCCINAVFGGPSYRMFSPDHVIKEIDILVNKYGVKNIKFIDELFVLNEEHVEGICDRIIERGYDLNIWAYTRIDTLAERLLGKMRKAGIRWLAPGIESSSKHVRDGAKKKFGNQDILDTVNKIRSAGIYVIANYIFGLPDDTLETMQETLDLATGINSEWANFYCATAYPGSALYPLAKEKGLALPDDPNGPGWIGYSQHAYEFLPLPTETLSAADVLRFRDKAFMAYFTNPAYLKMIKNKFGDKVLEHVKKMTSIALKRKLLGE